MTANRNKGTEPARWPTKAGDYPGCSDGGCVFGHPGGMHTNGGCCCLESMRDPNDRVKVRGAIQRLLRAAAEPEAPVCANGHTKKPCKLLGVSGWVCECGAP